MDHKDKIFAFYYKNKRMPSYAEIMDLVGFRSKNAVSKLVHKLIDAGVLEKDSSVSYHYCILHQAIIWNLNDYVAFTRSVPSLRMSRLWRTFEVQHL